MIELSRTTNTLERSHSPIFFVEDVTMAKKKAKKAAPKKAAGKKAAPKKKK